MSKYGLQLRGKKPEQKQAARPPLPKVLGFGDDDDDDDNVERDILRQAYKNKTHRDVSLLPLYILICLHTNVMIPFHCIFGFGGFI